MHHDVINNIVCFILRRWYKFDDGDVTEVNMEDDEELKTQCWGGEYMSEVFDHMLKRMSYRRQKRWWNAYMLFYCRYVCFAIFRNILLIR